MDGVVRCCRVVRRAVHVDEITFCKGMDETHVFVEIGFVSTLRVGELSFYCLEECVNTF